MATIRIKRKSSKNNINKNQKDLPIQVEQPKSDWGLEDEDYLDELRERRDEELKKAKNHTAKLGIGGTILGTTAGYLAGGKKNHALGAAIGSVAGGGSSALLGRLLHNRAKRRATEEIDREIDDFKNRSLRDRMYIIRRAQRKKDFELREREVEARERSARALERLPWLNNLADEVSDKGKSFINKFRRK